MIDMTLYAEEFEEVFEKYEINTPLRKAHFVAQVAHESINMTQFTESLNYSVKALIKTFSRSRISIADAYKYGRHQGKAADQVMIGNILYGGEYGKQNLGNVEKNDGYNFRGRGAFQCTGRGNYKRFSTYFGVDFVKNPDLMAQPYYGLMFAGWYWKVNGLNALADADDIVKITRKINGALNGIDDRKLKLKQYKKYYNA